MTLAWVSGHEGHRVENRKSEDWWKNIPDYRQTKKFLAGYRPTFTVDIVNRDRKSVRTIVGLLTGHCMFRKHMSNLGLTEKAICRFSQTEEDTFIRVLYDNISGYTALKKWARNIQNP
ncbi:hypothetical protein Trydic_g20038 [Trypoxylus dichotomus]